MRVLHVIDALRPGGKERQLVELLKGMAHQPDIHSEVALLSKDIHYDEFRGLSVPTHVFERRWRRDPTIFMKLHRLIGRNRIDIVQSWDSMCSVYAAPATRLRRAVFVNGMVQNAPPGRSARPRDFFRARITVPFSDVVFGNSQAGLDAYGIPAAKAVCIHNGFDWQRVANLPAKEKVRAELGIVTPHVVGMVASFTDRKDWPGFFRVAEKIGALRDDVTFVAIGGGPNLAAFRARYPADSFPRMKLLGIRQDVESIVNLFSVGMLLSKTSDEGIANAIVEYMALAKPVVASDCAGNRESVQDGETGYITTDADDAARAVMELLDDPGLAGALGAAGKERIEEEFGLDLMIERFATLYRGLLARRGGRRAGNALSPSGDSR